MCYACVNIGKQYYFSQRISFGYLCLYAERELCTFQLTLSCHHHNVSILPLQVSSFWQIFVLNFVIITYLTKNFWCYYGKLLYCVLFVIIILTCVMNCVCLLSSFSTWLSGSSIPLKVVEFPTVWTAPAIGQAPPGLMCALTVFTDNTHFYFASFVLSFCSCFFMALKSFFSFVILIRHFLGLCASTVLAHDNNCSLVISFVFFDCCLFP